MATPDRHQMGEQARNVLLAEALGDLKDLVDLVREVDEKMKAYAKQFELGETKAWLSVLDSKMQEFKHFQIPEIAAARLQVHSETFLRGVMSEVKHLVSLEIDRQSQKQKLLLWAVIFLSGFAAATLLRLFF